MRGDRLWKLRWTEWTLVTLLGTCVLTTSCSGNVTLPVPTPETTRTLTARPRQAYPAVQVPDPIKKVKLRLATKITSERCVDAVAPKVERVCLPDKEDQLVTQSLRDYLSKTGVKIVGQDTPADLLLFVEMKYYVNRAGRNALVVRPRLFEPGPADEQGWPRAEIAGCDLEVTPRSVESTLDNEWIAAEVSAKLAGCHQVKTFAETKYGGASPPVVPMHPIEPQPPSAQDAGASRRMY